MIGPGSFRDVPFDVVLFISVAANGMLFDVPAEIRNADAIFLLDGLQYLPVTGSASIQVQDATGRAISSQPLDGLGSLAAFTQAGPMGSFQYLAWPKNSRIRVNVQELLGNSATGWLLFRGFKRYREGSAC